MQRLAQARGKCVQPAAQIQDYSQRYVDCEPQFLFDLAVSGVRFAEFFGVTENHLHGNRDVGKYFPM